MQSDIWAGKALDTQNRQNTFRNEHYHIVYQKALEMSRSSAYAALLCDYVFEVMDQRFASRALPRECDIYLTAQVCLAYARYGNDIDRLRASLQNIVAQRSLESGESKAQVHGEEEVSGDGVSPEWPQQEDACKEKASGREQEPRTERKEEPQVENRYAKTREAEKPDPLKQADGSGAAQTAKPDVYAAAQGGSAGGQNGMPAYGQQIPYGQPLYYGYPYGMPVMPAPGVAQVFSYGQQMTPGMVPAPGMPYAQESMKPYMPYVQPMVYFTAPVFYGFPPAGMMQLGMVLPQQAGQPAPGQTQMRQEEERAQAQPTHLRSRAHSAQTENVSHRKAGLRDAQRRDNQAARSKRKMQPAERSNPVRGMRKPEPVPAGPARAGLNPQKDVQMAGGREKMQPVRQAEPMQTPVEAGRVSLHSVVEPELPKVVKISAPSVQADDTVRTQTAGQSAPVQQVSPEQAPVAVQGEAAQQATAVQSEAVQQPGMAPKTAAEATQNAPAAASQSDAEMATIVKNTVYNRTATKLWMPGDAIGVPEDEQNEGEDEDEEEEEERSVRLSVLNTGLVLLTIPAVMFLLMEMGIIPIVF